MHPSAYEQMRLCVQTYLRPDRHYRVLDVGARQAQPGHRTHRELLAELDCSYLGVDVAAGPNVDVVMRRPYRLPVRSGSVDVVMSNQTFEHIAFPWASFMEIARVLRPGGFVFLVMPSRGHPHGTGDCWRYYPDAMRALAAFARLELRENWTDLPPRVDGTQRLDYAAIGDGAGGPGYWGDSVGVFRKPERYSLLVRPVREVVIWWADRVGGIEAVPRPTPRPRLRAARNAARGA